MEAGKSNRARQATWFLILGTAFWGISFPAMKALTMIQQKFLPDGSTWYFASLSLVVRFGISSVILALWSARTLRKMTAREWEQGIGLGLAGGVGLLFQMDGVNYTSASTAAFLTQCYCLFIPLFVATRARAWPAAPLLIGCVMVIAGAVFLSGLDWRAMRLGRGELETIIASLFFTVQILWLERPKFAGNNMMHVTVLMFALNLISVLPVFFLTKPSWPEVAQSISSGPVLLLYAALTFLCTLGSYTLMNFWQPYIEATRAGLIYCAEPVFASLLALFLPGILSAFAEINYPNETVTAALLIGGSLITGANILIMVSHPTPVTHGPDEANGKL